MKPPPLPTSKENLIVTTGNDIAGHAIEKYLGIVRGIVVRSPGFARGLSGSLKALNGGNIAEFSALCEEARHDAYEQMVMHALELGADAVIAFRYDANEFSQGLSEVLAYGTAVKLGE